MTLPLKDRLMNKRHIVDANILTEIETSIIQTLFWKKDFKNSLNREIIKATIILLIEIERFDDTLF